MKTTRFYWLGCTGVGSRLAAVAFLVGCGVAASRADLPVSGAAFHLDAADTNTVILEGNSVTNWRDKGSSGLNVTPPTTADRPTYVAWPAKAGLSAVHFELDDWLSNATGTPFSDAGPWTVFVVLKARKSASSGGNFLASGLGSARIVLYFYDNAARSFRAGTEFANAFYGDGQYLLYSTILNGSGSASWINGVNQVAGTLNSAAAHGNSIAIGNEGDGGAFAGEIAEVVVYNSALTDTDRQSVEGYLEDKWLSSSDLPVSGAAFHLDANDASTVMLDGNSVTNWRDKGRSGLNVTPPTAGDRPTLTAWPAKAGLSAVRFETTNWLRNATTSPFADAGPWTVFAVLKARKSVLDDGNFVGGGSGNARAVLYFYDNAIRSFRGGTEFANFNYTNGQYLLYSAVWNGTGSASWINGANQATGSVGNATAHATEIDIGNENDSGFYAGEIAEFAIYNTALTDYERQSVEQYLYHKWLYIPPSGTVVLVR